MKLGTSTVLSLLALACTTTAHDIPLEKLLANPRFFNGKRVVVTGYYVAGTETSCLFTTRRAAKRFDVARSIWVEFRNAPAVDSITDRKARLVGTFHFSPTVRVRGLREYGNLWSVALLDVTDFGPLR